MSYYAILRSLLFTLEPERAHKLTFMLLRLLHRFHLLHLLVGKLPQSQSFDCLGLHFPNRLGVAAGLDKNADYIDLLAALGFGFIEIGTVTPRPQPGNPKPRLFRLPKAEALINRLGFNNQGVEYVKKRLEKLNFKGILGINIGKNKSTPLDNANEDYLFALRELYLYADYFTINISSPNTPELRQLQFGQALDDLLSALKQAQAQCAEQHKRYVPLLVKVAPDMSDDELKSFAKSVLKNKIEGVIAINTTIDRSAVAGLLHGDEQGGLSGAPLTQKADDFISHLRALLGADFPLIGVGGIMSQQGAINRIDKGADLVQIYSGLIYRGPQLIKEILSVL